jgi:hypothetical protein
MRKRHLLKWLLLVLALLLGWWLLFGQRGVGLKFDISGRTLQDELSAEMKTLQEQSQNITAENAMEAISATAMRGARYVGQDGSGRAWQVTADTVQQQGSTVNLGAVSATAETGKANAVQFNAARGAYNQQTNELELTDNVTLEGYGIAVSTSALRSNLTTGTAASDATVTIKTVPNGNTLDAEIVAGQLDLTDNGDIIRLTNGVSATFHAPSTSPSQP